MIWQVGRILTELKEEKQLPDVLIMENVPTVCGEKNKEDFNKWLNFLENLGYQSYYKILSATDYGIPQTRRRCFVVSLLGEYYYDFPDGFPLELKLKDMLEDNCSEKYYLSEKMINYISKTDTKNFVNKDCRINLDIARTLTTEQNKRASTSNYICKELPREFDLNKLKANAKEYIKSITNNIKDKNLKETIEKNELPIGEVRNLDTYNRTTSELSQTLTLPNHNSQRLWDGLRIRKLTPRECFRLMGVRDKDYDKLKGKFSDSALYHMSGDSIVVNVLMAIFSQML